MTNQHNALVIGASRGIGLGLCLELQARGWNVTATRRTTTQQDDQPAINWHTLDINNTEQVATFSQLFPVNHFSAVIVNAGVSGPLEQSVSSTTTEELMQLFMTNTFSPIRVAQAILPSVKVNTGILAFTSSALASLNENTHADMPLYSASKAALNILTRALLPEAQKHNITLLSLHPGWVQTDMGGSAAPVTVKESTHGLVNQVEAYQGLGGHTFVDYQGNKLMW